MVLLFFYNWSNSINLVEFRNYLYSKSKIIIIIILAILGFTTSLINCNVFLLCINDLNHMHINCLYFWNWLDSCWMGKCICNYFLFCFLYNENKKWNQLWKYNSLIIFSWSNIYIKSNFFILNNFYINDTPLCTLPLFK